MVLKIGRFYSFKRGGGLGVVVFLGYFIVFIFWLYINGEKVLFNICLRILYVVNFVIFFFLVYIKVREDFIEGEGGDREYLGIFLLVF